MPNDSATQLSEATGIPVEVATAWLAIQPQDQPNATNPLNILHQPNNAMQVGSQGMYGTYHTPEDSFRDVAAMLQNPIYENLRLAIANGDPLTVARGIELSPWDNLHYGSTYPVADGRLVESFLGVADVPLSNMDDPITTEPVATDDPVIELPEFNTNVAGTDA